MLVAILCTMAASVAEAAPPDRTPLAGDVAKAKEVWGAFDAWLRAYSAGDMKGVMAIFDRDVRFSFQGSPDRSYSELEGIYARDFHDRKPGTQWVPEVEEVYADGSLAFVKATWELRVSGADGRSEVKARNRSLDVLRRRADGAWLIFRSMNYPVR